MENPPAETRNTDDGPFKKWGFWAVIVGAVALILVFIQIGAPMMEPKPSVGTQIGEIAGEIKRSAWRSFLGLSGGNIEPEPVSATSYLTLTAPILGVVAIVLALISGLLRENWRYPVYATGLGASAILFHFFWWIALLFAGVLILVAIIENIGDIFNFG
ncbi:MAG: hypothetical protein AAF530_25595 [Pseudomonadota bacterium]